MIGVSVLTNGQVPTSAQLAHCTLNSFPSETYCRGVLLKLLLGHISPQLVPDFFDSRLDKQSGSGPYFVHAALQHKVQHKLNSHIGT
jgi:hypothetical protein